MNNLRSLILRVAFPMCLGVLLAVPQQVTAQVGDNAVCTSTSGCTTITSSSAFIDASAFSGADICAKINNVLKSSSYPSVGTVIDARGIGTGTSQSCANSPWNGITNPPPSVILLPSGTITIPATWGLPDRTRIFGEGERAGSGQSGTVLAAHSSFTTGTPMIQFGSSACGSGSGVCFGVSLQDVMLDGGNQNIVGVSNQNSQELSYLNHVQFYRIEGTGLLVSGVQSQNSGPYQNLTCALPSFASTTVCVDLDGVPGTRGVHGLTATASSGSSSGPSAAFLLDSPNTTVEDAHFEGFQDGILIGANSNAYGDVVFNISGTNGAGPMTNVVEISNANQVYSLSLMGITNDGAVNSIKDDETSTTISDLYVGAYFLGNPLGGGFTRLTTSKSTVTWAVGSSTPTGGCPTGSIFSNTSGTSGSTLWVCVASAWSIAK